MGMVHHAMNSLATLKARFAIKVEPEHLRRGKLGEHAAKKYLQRQGMKFLTGNFRSKRGEVDLIFRAADDYPSSSASWMRRIPIPFFPLVCLFSDWGVLPKRLNTKHLKFMRNATNSLQRRSGMNTLPRHEETSPER
jgi:hypothetical protein